MRRIARTGAVLALIACGGDARAPANVVSVTDSAGVRLVTSPASEQVYARLAETPSLSIGTVDGPAALLFNGIISALRDEEGNVVIADLGSSQIRVFDEGGTHLQTMGGRGDGPGEFQSLAGAWPIGEGRILAQGVLTQRFTEFGPSGTVTSTARLLPENLGGFLWVDGIQGDRGVVARLWEAGPTPAPAEVGQVARGTLWVLVLGFDGAVLDTVARLEAPAQVRLATGQLSVLPLSPLGQAAGSRDLIAATAGRAYEIRLHDSEGGLRRISRIEERPPVRTNAHVEAWARQNLRGQCGEPASPESLEPYREFPLPETLPAYVRLLFGADGELWAQRHRALCTSPLRWDVFAADGPYLGRVEVPASLWITEIRRGQVLGVHVDELGIERVQAYELIFD